MSYWLVAGPGASMPCTRVDLDKKHDKGGHFAAWEQPELLVSDLRASFKSLR